jgi:hypothetical protein
MLTQNDLTTFERKTRLTPQGKKFEQQGDQIIVRHPVVFGVFDY